MRESETPHIRHVWREKGNMGTYDIQTLGCGNAHWTFRKSLQGKHAFSNYYFDLPYR